VIHENCALFNLAAEMDLLVNNVPFISTLPWNESSLLALLFCDSSLLSVREVDHILRRAKLARSAKAWFGGFYISSVAVTNTEDHESLTHYERLIRMHLQFSVETASQSASGLAEWVRLCMRRTMISHKPENSSRQRSDMQSMSVEKTSVVCRQLGCPAEQIEQQEGLNQNPPSGPEIQAAKAEHLKTSTPCERLQGQWMHASPRCLRTESSRTVGSGRLHILPQLSHEAPHALTPAYASPLELLGPSRAMEGIWGGRKGFIEGVFRRWGALLLCEAGWSLRRSGRMPEKTT